MWGNKPCPRIEPRPTSAVINIIFKKDLLVDNHRIRNFFHPINLVQFLQFPDSQIIVIKIALLVQKNCPTVLPNVIFEERLIGEFSELQLQFSLLLRVAGQILQILQISAVICRFSRFHEGLQILSQNSTLKNLQKPVPKKSYNLLLSE